ncbi:MAG TPA: hypothetical protein VF665_17735 [Longimicrobium sp.]|jgi:hypothetical protein|uniref:hypothetical protein n=1 Tax=Longimicrobium sp. TaxID=2029185 RepID=UPI002ED9F8A1
MNHYPIAAAAAGLLLAAAPHAGAQGWTRAPRAEMGVYAGGSGTSNWFQSRTVTLNGTADPVENDDEAGYSPGYAPVFGAEGTFWFSPAFGLRAHGAYAPMQPPRPSGDFFQDVGESSNYVVNTWLYDLSLIVRPFVRTSGGDRLASVYLWAGGGGVTSNPAGSGQVCAGYLVPLGACLVLDPTYSSVGQGTAGAGMDLLRFGSLALFGEAGVHVYDSPVHVGDDYLGPITGRAGTVAAIADDRVAVTGRLVLGLKALFGDLLPRPPAAPPLPPPPPPMAPAPPPPPPAAPAMREIQVCVVDNGALRTMTAMVDPQTGDTTYAGGMTPAMTGYAAGATWFINNEPVMVMGRRYVKYGVPRVLGVTDVTRVGEYQGVSVFAENGAAGMPEVIYLPVRSGCEFQPYQVDVKAGAVRGE